MYILHNYVLSFLFSLNSNSLHYLNGPYNTPLVLDFLCKLQATLDGKEGHWHLLLGGGNHLRVLSQGLSSHEARTCPLQGVRDGVRR